MDTRTALCSEQSTDEWYILQPPDPGRDGPGLLFRQPDDMTSRPFFSLVRNFYPAVIIQRIQAISPQVGIPKHSRTPFVSQQRKASTNSSRAWTGKQRGPPGEVHGDSSPHASLLMMNPGWHQVGTLVCDISIRTEYIHKVSISLALLACQGQTVVR